MRIVTRTSVDTAVLLPRAGVDQAAARQQRPGLGRREVPGSPDIAIMTTELLGSASH
jgi:hypothetical protein